MAGGRVPRRSRPVGGRAPKRRAGTAVAFGRGQRGRALGGCCRGCGSRAAGRFDIEVSRCYRRILKEGRPPWRGVEVARGKGRLLQGLGRTRWRMLHLGARKLAPLGSEERAFRGSAACEYHLGHFFCLPAGRFLFHNVPGTLFAESPAENSGYIRPSFTDSCVDERKING